MSDHEEVIDTQEVEVAVEASSGQMSVEDALQEVLRRALVHDGLARGLKEAVKALDRRQAHLAVLVESCTESEYLKLVEALCAEHNINLIKVSDAKKLGEWSGLCRLIVKVTPVRLLVVLVLLLPTLEKNPKP
ncbi:unnamed protein product [Rhizopus stolonifer]